MEVVASLLLLKLISFDRGHLVNIGRVEKMEDHGKVDVPEGRGRKRKHNGSQWCGAINCSANKMSDPDVSFHRFPKDAARSKMWVQLSRRADLVGMSSDYLNTNVKICSKHFESSQFVGDSKLRQLKRDAVPTLFAVPNPPKLVTTKRLLKTRQNGINSASENDHLEHPIVEWGGIETIFQGGSTAEQQEKENLSPSESASPGVEPAAAPQKNKSQSTSASALANKYRCRARRQAKQLGNLRRKQPVTTEQALSHLETVLPAKIVSFVRFQVKVSAAKPYGCRYSDEELMYSLTLYYQGARAYRQLRKRFILPSPRVLRNRMTHIQTLPGFQDMLLEVLKEQLEGAADQDKLVVLSFDEIHLRKKLTYVRWMDCVEGNEDFGGVGKTPRLADSALTFMVRGLSKRWKQPVGYFFSAGPASAEVMEKLLEQMVRKVRQAGLVVAATVCDMGKPNQKLYGKLGVTAESPQFEVDGIPVIAMFDVPHIIKNIRNCLFSRDITVDGKAMSWQHVKAFYLADSGRTIRAAPKLRRTHVLLGPFKKMKVSLATQVFSRSVASGMQLYADPAIGLLKPEILPTADGLLRLNNCFDVLNSSRSADACKNKRAFSSRTEEGHRRVLLETRNWLTRWADVASVDSVKGLQLTISAVLLLWSTVKDKMKFLLTRRLSQDGLENFFGAIRQVGHQNDNPNPSQFREAFRKTAVNNMMTASEHGNCEPDADRLLAALTSVSARCSRPQPSATVHFNAGPQPPVMCVPIDKVTDNVLSYVAGYLVHKSEGDHTCPTCEAALCSGQTTVTRDREGLIGLKCYTGLRNVDVGGLKVPSDGLFNAMKAAYETTEAQMSSVLFEQGVVRRLMDCVASGPAYSALMGSMCGKGRLRRMIETFVRMQVHAHCRHRTASSGPGVNRKNRKHVKLTACA